MKIIGIAGKAHSGKDTMANRLVTRHKFVRYGFADPMKDGLSVAFDVPRSFFDDPSLKELPHPNLCGKTPRQAAQWFGTEYGRKLLGEEVWLLAADRKLTEAKKSGSAGFVVSDVRLAFEANWVRQHGGRIWHVWRPNAPKTHEHETEGGVPVAQGDLIIHNDGTVDELIQKVDMYAILG